MLRTFWGSKCISNKNIEPQKKIRRSYKKKSVYTSDAKCDLTYPGKIPPGKQTNKQTATAPATATATAAATVSPISDR